MAINIKNAEADALVRQLVERTGETITDAVLKALRERLARTQAPKASLKEELSAIRRRCARLRVVDPRGADEILGYDDHGLPR